MIGRKAMKTHMKDTVEYRTMEYYQRQYRNKDALEKGE